MAANAATMTVAAEKKVATGDTEVTINGLPVGYYLVMVTSGSETCLLYTSRLLQDIVMNYFLLKNQKITGNYIQQLKTEAQVQRVQLLMP